MLAQAYIGYDVPQTLILIRMFARRIILFLCIVILIIVTMATEIYGRLMLTLETLTQ